MTDQDGKLSDCQQDLQKCESISGLSIYNPPSQVISVSHCNTSQVSEKSVRPGNLVLPGQECNFPLMTWDPYVMQNPYQPSFPPYALSFTPYSLSTVTTVHHHDVIRFCFSFSIFLSASFHIPSTLLCLLFSTHSYHPSLPPPAYPDHAGCYVPPFPHYTLISHAIAPRSRHTTYYPFSRLHHRPSVSRGKYLTTSNILHHLSSSIPYTYLSPCTCLTCATSSTSFQSACHTSVSSLCQPSFTSVPVVVLSIPPISLPQPYLQSPSR